MGWCGLRKLSPLVLSIVPNVISFGRADITTNDNSRPVLISAGAVHGESIWPGELFADISGENGGLFGDLAADGMKRELQLDYLETLLRTNHPVNNEKNAKWSPIVMTLFTDDRMESAIAANLIDLKDQNSEVTASASYVRDHDLTGLPGITRMDAASISQSYKTKTVFMRHAQAVDAQSIEEMMDRVADKARVVYVTEDSKVFPPALSSKVEKKSFDDFTRADRTESQKPSELQGNVLLVFNMKVYSSKRALDKNSFMKAVQTSLDYIVNGTFLSFRDHVQNQVQQVPLPQFFVDLYGSIMKNRQTTAITPLVILANNVAPQSVSSRRTLVSNEAKLETIRIQPVILASVFSMVIFFLLALIPICCLTSISTPKLFIEKALVLNKEF